MCASLARSTVLHPGESMKNSVLGQEEVYSCAFWLLTLTSLCNPWDLDVQVQETPVQQLLQRCYIFQRCGDRGVGRTMHKTR
jgi:hypothetical protein